MTEAAVASRAAVAKAMLTFDPTTPEYYADPYADQAFTPRRVDVLRQRARTLAAELFARARAAVGDGPVDLVSAVTQPVPALVLGALLGVSEAEEPRFSQWCAAIERGLDLGVFLTPEQLVRRDEVRHELTVYFGELAERRRAQPRDLRLASDESFIADSISIRGVSQLPVLVRDRGTS